MIKEKRFSTRPTVITCSPKAKREARGLGGMPSSHELLTSSQAIKTRLKKKPCGFGSKISFDDWPKSEQSMSWTNMSTLGLSIRTDSLQRSSKRLRSTYFHSSPTQRMLSRNWGTRSQGRYARRKKTSCIVTLTCIPWMRLRLPLRSLMSLWTITLAKTSLQRWQRT